MKSKQQIALWIALTIVSNALCPASIDLPGWQPKPGEISLSFGMYVSPVSTNFAQTVTLRKDGTFESRFSGEIHKDGEDPRWTEFSFSGKWRITDGRIAFTYSDTAGERSDSFAIGEWESRTAFRFSRPNDPRCAFVAELFVLKEKAAEPGATDNPGDAQ